MKKILNDKNINLVVEMDTDLSSHPKELKKYKNFLKKQVGSFSNEQI